MARAIRTLLLIGASIFLGGCSTATPWTSQPIDAGPLVARARCVAAPLLLRFTGERPLHLDVLDSDIPAAYSWPGGRICVTRGLVALLDDAELTAAIAHEIGHLLNDGSLQTRVALNGTAATPSRDIEEAADDTGVTLLTQCAGDAAAMSRMLKKVEQFPLTPRDCRAALTHRAARLTATPR